jgi:N-carbamoyl-L-amino-acid hydrolase
MPAPVISSVTVTLGQLNAASVAEFVSLLDGTYEHSSWIAECAALA